MSADLVKTNGRGTLLERLGARYLPDTPKAEVLSILQQTAFKTGKDQPPASSAQVAALLVVADQYGLNPWTKEIYAFPDKQNGIVPVVGVDGWNRIANEHPQFAGETLELPPHEEWLKIDDDAKLAPPWMRVLVYRKDRDHPTDHTEYLDECYREAFTTKNNYKVKGPWQSHTKRMLEHKARIQARRIAFGFSGIYDQDEAERIVDADYDVEGTAVEIETLGDEAWQALVGAAADLGFNGDDVLANAGALGFEGPGADMPRDVAERLYRGLREAGSANHDDPIDDEPATAPQAADPGDETAAVASGAALAPGGDDAAAFWPEDGAPEEGAPEEEPPGRGPLHDVNDPNRPATATDKRLLSEALQHVPTAWAKTYRKRFSGRSNAELTHGEIVEFTAAAAQEATS